MCLGCWSANVHHIMSQLQYRPTHNFGAFDITVSMSVCVCLSLCPCVHVCMCLYEPVSMCPCLYMSVWVCVHVSMSVCVCVSLCPCVHVCMCLCESVSMCPCLYESVCEQKPMWMPLTTLVTRRYMLCLLPINSRAQLLMAHRTHRRHLTKLPVCTRSVPANSIH